MTRNMEPNPLIFVTFIPIFIIFINSHKYYFELLFKYQKIIININLLTNWQLNIVTIYELLFSQFSSFILNRTCQKNQWLSLDAVGRSVWMEIPLKSLKSHYFHRKYNKTKLWLHSWMQFFIYCVFPSIQWLEDINTFV